MAADDGVEDQFSFDDSEGKIEDVGRLERLRNTGLLTAHHRPALDALTSLATQVAEAPLAGIGLVALDRVVFPSLHSLEGPEKAHDAALSGSFCHYVVMNDAPLLVEDTRTHPVLSTHPAVLDGTVLAYAGLPVHAPDGEVLGALCAMDVVPRTWTSEQVTGLTDLSTAVETKIALRLSQRALHLDHERLMHVLDGAAHTMIIIADADGVILTLNKTAMDAIRPVMDPGAKNTLADLARAGHPREDPYGDVDEDAQDWVLNNPSGEQRIFSMRVSELLDPDGEVDGWIVAGDDVSARRRTEDLLRDTVRKQANAVERLEVLDAERSTFIATASHELRTPVTSVLGYAELLVDGKYGELTPPQHAVASRVVRGGRRLQHLIEDLLSLDRINSAQVDLVRTGVDVNRLAQQAWDSLQVHFAGRDLRTTIDVPADLPKVSGDAVELERALLNLLTNAVKFTPDGGAVRLSAQTDPHGVCFEVSDTGIGISEEDQEAVFEPFFRTRNAHTSAVPGAGIGLAVVRSIIKSHGGELALTSAVDQGTRVRFTIAAHLAGQTKVA